MSTLKIVKALLEKDPDNVLLHYSLGNEYLKIEEFENAISQLKKAVELQPAYSAAWKLYARALAENKQKKAAIDAYEKGIKIAEENGDKQAAKEMQVFLKRLKNNH